ncbi:MAG: hypothetical protein R3B65_00395 [Candidatus Paceibacterota bacterium]
MVHKLVEVPKELKPARKSGGQDDEIDAIAVGITCFCLRKILNFHTKTINLLQKKILSDKNIVIIIINFLEHGTR